MASDSKEGSDTLCSCSISPSLPVIQSGPKIWKIKLNYKDETINPKEPSKSQSVLNCF